MRVLPFSLKNFIPFILFFFGYLLGGIPKVREAEIKEDNSKIQRPIIQNLPKKINIEEKEKLDIERIGNKIFVDHLKGWNRIIPETYPKAEDMYKGKICKCDFAGKSFDFVKMSKKENKDKHLEDFELWKRDFYFEINKPPIIISKSNLPVEYVSSGYEIEPIESVELKIKIVADPEKKVSGRFTAHFGEVRWTGDGEMAVFEMNKALEKARYYPKFYDARK